MYKVVCITIWRVLHEQDLRFIWSHEKGVIIKMSSQMLHYLQSTYGDGVTKNDKVTWDSYYSNEHVHTFKLLCQTKPLDKVVVTDEVWVFHINFMFCTSTTHNAQTIPRTSCTPVAHQLHITQYHIYMTDTPHIYYAQISSAPAIHQLHNNPLKTSFLYKFLKKI